MKKRILFIINPTSGVGRQRKLEELIRQEMDEHKWEVDVELTDKAGHARELSKNAVGNYEVVVAVGGDGTVNEVGTALLHSKTTLGIVPTGSGNGLARFLQMPFKINKSLEVINHGLYKTIDAIRLNEFYSLNVAGIGFDAYISHLFAKKKRRGPLTYMQLISKEFARYKSQRYHLYIDKVHYTMDAFLISFANSSQYGNNVHIAPTARIDDGLIDVCLIKDFPKYTAPALLLSLLDQSINDSKYDRIVKARQVHISHPEPLQGHVDGEPVVFGNEADIEILPLALNVIVPPYHLRENSSFFQPLKEMFPR